jgi:1-acyl-sn-glycerol-3-phosphate acyltransferase
MMFYFKCLLLVGWFAFSSSLFLFYAIIFWRRGDINFFYGRFLAWGFLKVLGLRVEVEGAEFIEAVKPAVYIANHQSNFDLITFGGYYPKNTVVIGKKDIAWIPLFGLLYLSGRNLLIERKSKALAVSALNVATEAIQTRKASIWIFPEGTRNRVGEGLLPFKKGAFYVAVQAQVPIVPLVSAPLRSFVNWSERRLIGGTLKIRILPPISTVNLAESDVARIADETRSKMLEALNQLSKDRQGVITSRSGAEALP